MALARAYRQGIGAERDYDKAAYYFELASAQDAADADFELGSMYMKGQGVKKDERKGVELVRRAADKHNDVAESVLGFFYAQHKRRPIPVIGSISGFWPRSPNLLRKNWQEVSWEWMSHI